MAATAFVDGEDDGFIGAVEGGDEFADEMNGDERVVDEAEDGGFDVFFVFEGMKGDVDGGERAVFPVVVDENLGGREAELGADLVGVAAKDDASYADARVSRGGEEMFEEC